MMRHVLGLMGVVAAGILLAVSAAMNYRFGFSLGKSAIDGQIYGLASAAADCFKALVPFFFFAALRNKMWSQALAAALVWTVVTGYSMTSALGHAALNRLDTSGKRAVEAAAYADLRADSKRAQEQLGWIPQHRPAETVHSELNGLKGQRAWATTSGCTDVTGRSNREFCQQFHKLTAELASGLEAQKLETRIAEIGARLANTAGGTVLAEADPQASVLAKLSGLNVDRVQTALTLFVALLIEIGSGFGMYVAFAHWRLHDQPAPRAPARTPAHTVAAAVETAPPEAVRPLQPVAEPDPQAEEETASEEGPPVRRFGANDNKIVGKPLLPDSDVERYYRERIVASGGASLTSQDLYESYCSWCEERDKEPFAMPTFSREFKSFGIRKERIGGRTRYFDIALRPTGTQEKEKKLADKVAKAA
ncbi:MAG TPA: hypothetical protein VN523_01650 [Hyphomicrobiaceae bacterium]|jgi:hypothetical protein|nr:hypothetical protein [Hyphomicrobiaceae bacterium]